jgi:hypothetical protein
MANVPFVDGNGDSRYLAANGAGTNGDPFIVKQEMQQATHDSLNSNANIQVGNTDVGNANPVPVSDAGGALTIDDGGGSITVDGTTTVQQATHDNLNTNANLQYGNLDVSTTRPLPVISKERLLGAWQYTTSADMSAADAELTPAPTASERLVISDVVVSAAVNMLLTLKEETSGNVVMVLALTANQPVSVHLGGRVRLALDKKLLGRTSASGSVYITVCYVSEP